MNTNKAKHTPGPWDSADGHIIGDLGGSPRTLGKLFHDGEKADIHANEIPDKEQDANAALIAAAPELLAALESLAGRIKTCPDCNGTGKENEYQACDRCGGQGEIQEDCTQYISDIRAAIAKAKGE